MGSPYFPPSYFPASYFPPSYAGGSGGPSAAGEGAAGSAGLGYFGGGYFAPDYFGQSFFAGTGAAAVAPTPTATSLLQAVQLYWNSPASGLSTAVGPLYAGRATAGKAPPFARVNVVHHVPTYTTGDSYTESVMLDISIFAPTERDADELGETVAEAFDFAPAASITWRRGTLLQMRRTGGRLMADPGLGVADGADWKQIPTVFHRLISYTALVQRTLA